jgi:methyltransferase (TIGR00027 family)
MATIEHVSGTAFVVAEFRAEENLEPAPLYRDPIVALFLSEESRRAAKRVADDFPHVKDLVKIRTKYFDDTLDKNLLTNVSQVVILGSGLDTRAVRKAVPGVTYYEIDDAETMDVKRARYDELGLTLDLRLISGNYVTDGLIELLDRNGFDFHLPTYIIWEGNTMYLPLDRMKWVLTELATHVTRFRISFDYMAEEVISKTTGDPGVTKLVESFARMGAPWLSGLSDVGSLADEHGLSLVENFRTADLCRRYRPGRPITSPIVHFYSVCTVGQ